MFGNPGSLNNNIARDIKNKTNEFEMAQNPCKQQIAVIIESHFQQVQMQNFLICCASTRMLDLNVVTCAFCFTT